jgi:hypothetical protein
MAGGWLGSWGWGMWACQTGEREEVADATNVLLLRRLKPFGRLTKSSSISKLLCALKTFRKFEKLV